ncbi:glycoside hydrolase [Limtongia smithiae]|uniref:glycoside hydrolase n=1 Tax=Limtongia smithiae TaxID=1125753 RepID=UPI0034CF42E1
MKSVVYFPNWSIYARKYFVRDLPTKYITHVLYAFANVDTNTGVIKLTDNWSDTDQHHENDSWNDPDIAQNLYGNLHELYKLKRACPHVKVLLSVGGWTYSQQGCFAFSHDAGKRDAFARSARSMIDDFGLDGIDIDWEYPNAGAEAEYFVALLRATRSALDAGSGERRRYLLSIAAPCGETNMAALRVREMDSVLDFWNLMAYDFAGPGWSSRVAHQANLFAVPTAESSCDSAVRHYTAHGVRPTKLVLGMPLYGRVFGGCTSASPGCKFAGHGSANADGAGTGSWEAGVFDYKALPRPGASEHFDSASGAGYSFDPSSREFVTYETPHSAVAKVRYVVEKGLGGVMWWEASADAQGAQSLVRTAAEALEGAGRALDGARNCVDYPQSRYKNIREGL